MWSLNGVYPRFSEFSANWKLSLLKKNHCWHVMHVYFYVPTNVYKWCLPAGRWRQCYRARRKWALTSVDLSTRVYWAVCGWRSIGQDWSWPGRRTTDRDRMREGTPTLYKQCRPPATPLWTATSSLEAWRRTLRSGRRYRDAWWPCRVVTDAGVASVSGSRRRSGYRGLRRWRARRTRRRTQDCRLWMSYHAATMASRSGRIWAYSKPSSRNRSHLYSTDGLFYYHTVCVDYMGFFLLFQPRRW